MDLKYVTVSSKGISAHTL